MDNTDREIANLKRIMELCDQISGRGLVDSAIESRVSEVSQFAFSFDFMDIERGDMVSSLKKQVTLKNLPAKRKAESAFYDAVSKINGLAGIRLSVLNENRIGSGVKP